jgi:hypothetical protein
MLPAREQLDEAQHAAAGRPRERTSGRCPTIVRIVRHFHERLRGRLAIASIAALVFAFAYLIQPAWDNERAHYDLTRALAAGSPTIDESLRHPALRTVDKTRFRGHAYAAKEPGLAAVSVPPYMLLKATGVKTTGSPKRLVWALHLWGVVLPAAVLLLLVRRRAENVAPGFGTIAAVSLGSATLVLPFSTVFFSHVLAATLGFAAFTLLARERERGPSLWLVFAGGLAAGLAFSVEYPLCVVALALAVLALAGGDRGRRVSLYGLGVAAGALPALAANTWMFGTPFHLPQEGWHHQGSAPLPGLLGITQPTLDNALRIVFYPGGIGPILLPALVGAVLLWRRGARLQGALPLLIAGLLLLFNSASANPFGGASPGPRFMIAALPFLALPLAYAFRAIPGATLGLLSGGAAFMVAATLTTPLEAWDGLVAHRVITGSYVESVGSFVGLDDSAWDVPFLLALGIAAVTAIVATPWRVTRHRDAVAAAVALLGWLVLATKTQGLLQRGVAGQAVVLLVAAATALLVTVAYRARLSLRPPPSVQSTGTER